MRALLRGMLDAVVTIDPRGIVRETSQSVRDVFGWEPSELVGQNVSVLMPEPHRAKHDEYLKRYLETGKTWILGTTRVFQVVRKDGAPVVCELSVARVDVPGEAEPSFCGCFRDVTARVRAEDALAEKERRYRSIFEHEYQYVGLLRPDGVVIDGNPAYLEATGATREAVLGKPLWDAPWWGRDESRARLRDAVERAAAGELVRFEVELGTPSGELRALDFSIKPIRDESGAVLMLLPEGRDITALKRAQVRETAMLRALASIGESATLLAHEIKNPITAVNLALRAVASHLGQDDRLVLEELVGRMQKLERLMRRTLSFARPLELHVEPRDVAELVRAVAETARPALAAQRSALAIEADGPLIASVDAHWIEELLANLLGNAAEALEEGGRVRVRARPAETGGIEVLVDDDGPGIPDGLRERLFQPFVTSKEQGTGLGLPIARKIALEHGGELEAGDSDLGGARFRLWLPAARG